ncbi:MAG: hypothetical protein LBH11_06795, partial [Propionibacteriaceae bacterium]|nr:hypothetical protein [Propionibacteriaceae bacterium]
MANPGRQIALEVSTQASRQEVYARLMAVSSGAPGGYFDGTKTNADGTSHITIERKFVPVWAIVVAIVGFFFVLIGLLALLVKTTETCQITLTEQ